MRVVEFQKRGLPHAHILLIMEHDDMPHCVDYDLAVSAEIPDPHAQPQLIRQLSRPYCTLAAQSAVWTLTLCNKGFLKPFSALPLG